MQYFVSIENNAYCHWQVELLIESFKMQGLEDDLVISVAASQVGTYKQFTDNLIHHESKFQHKNYGDERGCKKINKIYGLVAALKNDIIAPPFTLIHPDMLLISPIPDEGESGITYHAYNTEEDQVTRLIREAIIHCQKDPKWHMLGDTMVFRDVHEDLFVEMLGRYDNLLNRIGNDWDVERLAWLFTLWNHPEVKLHQAFLECQLAHDKPRGNFIHYKHGFPPGFHKRHFSFEDSTGFALSTGDPFEALANVEQTKVNLYVQQVIRSRESPKSFMAKPVINTEKPELVITDKPPEPQNDPIDAEALKM